MLDSTSTVSGTPENDAQKELQAKIKDLRSGIDKMIKPDVIHDGLKVEIKRI